VVVIPDALEMGKNEQQHVQEEGLSGGSEVEAPLWWLLLRPFSFKCLFLLLLSLSALISSLFWVLPRHTVTYSFDARDVIKQSGESQSPFLSFSTIVFLVVLGLMAYGKF